MLSPTLFHVLVPFLISAILGAEPDLNYLSSFWGPPHSELSNTADVLQLDQLDRSEQMLKDGVAVVTGASLGIGREIAG